MTLSTKPITPFWKTKNMAEMSREEWESLCDSCGKCCCIRLEDEDTGQIYITDVACKLFDPNVNVSQLHWMPQTCAYRLVAEGKDLPEYHHLVSGSRDTIHEVGMSVQEAVTSEVLVKEDDIPTRIVIWPGEPDIN